MPHNDFIGRAFLWKFPIFYFFFGLSRGWFIALNLEIQTIVEVECCSLPTVLCPPPHRRLFIHHNHFVIVPSLPCSSCHFWFKRGGRSGESLHMWEDADPKCLCPFSAPVCAKQRHRAGECDCVLSRRDKRKLPRREQTVPPFRLHLPGYVVRRRIVAMATPRLPAVDFFFFRVASVTKGIKKLA